MELKEIVKNHLVEEKETARLERVKANKNLREITVFTSDQVKICESYIKTLKDEGIKFKEIKVQGRVENIKKAVTMEETSEQLTQKSKDLFNELFGE